MNKLDQKEEYEVRVVDEIRHNYTTSFIGKINGVYVKVYLPFTMDIKYGDTFTVSGEIEVPRHNTIPKGFDYKKYLLSRKVTYILSCETAKYKSSHLHINNIKLGVNRYIDSRFNMSSAYIKTFILADKSEFDQDFTNQISVLGLSHLFAVSGLHIGLLVFFLDKLIRHKKKAVFISLILIIYMFITSFSPSVVRASLMYVLYKFVVYKKLPFHVIDVLSFIFIAYIVLNPFIIYNVGFVLSFTVTFSILLTQYIIKDKNKLHQILIITLIANLSTLPITLTFSYTINVYSILINVIMIFYMSFIILPIGYIAFLIPILDTIYYKITIPFEWIIETQSNIDLFQFNYAFFNSVFIIIYYIFIICMVLFMSSKYKLKMITLFVFYMIVQNYVFLFSATKQISVIDIYGDSILIKDEFNKCNILVDTGVDDDYNSVVNYIKSKQIKTLDIVIITHYHDDHMGELDDVIETFNIGNIIDYNSHPKELSCGTMNLEFHKTIQEFDENNRSVVFTLYINGDTYLFTGDIEQEREGELINQYILDSDYLKAGHHGSITSSSEDFIDSVKPHTALITSYYKNTHNHPSSIVIDRFTSRGIEVLRIDQDGTIIIEYRFGFKKKKTTPPY